MLRKLDKLQKSEPYEIWDPVQKQPRLPVRTQKSAKARGGRRMRGGALMMQKYQAFLVSIKARVPAALQGRPPRCQSIIRHFDTYYNIRKVDKFHTWASGRYRYPAQNEQDGGNSPPVRFFR